MLSFKIYGKVYGKSYSASSKRAILLGHYGIVSFPSVRNLLNTSIVISLLTYIQVLSETVLFTGDIKIARVV